MISFLSGIMTQNLTLHPSLVTISMLFGTGLFEVIQKTETGLHLQGRHEILKVYAHEAESCIAKDSSTKGGSGGHAPLENFKFRVSEMPFPAFFAGYFGKQNNALVRSQFQSCL